MPDEALEPTQLEETTVTVGPPAANAPLRRRWPSPLPLLAVYFGMINFVGVLTLDPIIRAANSGTPGVIFLGIVVAELMTTSALAVLGRGYWIVRWSGILAIEAALLFITLAAITVLRDGPHDISRVFLASYSVGPLISLAAKLPLLPLRLVWGLQLRTRGDSDSGPRAGQFTIGDMLGVTALTALVLGMAQLNPGSQGDWRPLLINSIVAFFAGLLVGLPATFVAFKVADTAVGCVMMLFYALAAAVSLFVILAAMLRSPSPASELFIFVLLLLLSACGMTALALWFVRGCGYELLRAGTVEAASPR